MGNDLSNVCGIDLTKSDAVNSCYTRLSGESSDRRKAFEDLKSRDLIPNIAGLSGSPFVHLEHVNITYNREWDAQKIEQLWFNAFLAAHDSREGAVLQRLHDNNSKQIGLAWANFGHQQFHLPREEQQNAPADIFKGVFGIEWPMHDFEQLQVRLNKLVPPDPRLRVERNIIPVHSVKLDDNLRHQLHDIDGVETDNAFEFRFGGCQFRVHGRECVGEGKGSYESHIGPAPWIDREEVDQKFNFQN